VIPSNTNNWGTNNWGQINITEVLREVVMLI
jgi:hypothetical protein